MTTCPALQSYLGNITPTLHELPYGNDEVGSDQKLSLMDLLFNGSPFILRSCNWAGTDKLDLTQVPTSALATTTLEADLPLSTPFLPLELQP